jgi:hypothetical protein
MKYELNIEKVRTGFIVKYDVEQEEGVFATFKDVFDEKEGEKKCMVDMLNFVKEYFGGSFCKHHKENVMVELKNQETLDKD